MPKPPISNKIKISLTKLRARGFSYKEIARMECISAATAFRYGRQISLGTEAKKRLFLKRFPSRAKSLTQWKEATLHANTLFFPNVSRNLLPLIVACLHWCEGNKKELSFINSDPSMVKVYVVGLQSIGVPLERIRFSLRSYYGHNNAELVSFWLDYLGVSKEKFGTIDHIEGKKQGKLQYGMCRVRVLKGAYDFKLIMSMIELVKKTYTLP